MRLPLLSAVVCLVVPAAARAEPEAVARGGDYQAPAGCPPADAFFSGVHARTPRARRAAEGAGARTFVVTLGARDGEISGTLVIRSTDDAESERVVSGDTCEEVVSALALIAALAIDPHASAAPVPVEAAAPPPPPSSPPAPAPASEVPAREAPRPSPTSGPLGGWRLATSVDASIAGGVTPRSAFGVPVMIHVLGARGTGGRALAPTFHLGFERASTGTGDVQGGASARFTWTVGIVEGCPHRFQSGPISFEPCLRFEAGALRGEGANIAPAREDTRAWLALGAALRAEWSVLGPLFVEAEAGARAPFFRTTYFFEPDTTIYRPPAVGALAGAGVGARFL
jgi:hypothetical protein